MARWQKLSEGGWPDWWVERRQDGIKQLALWGGGDRGAGRPRCFIPRESAGGLGRVVATQVDRRGYVLDSDPLCVLLSLWALVSVLQCHLG